MHNKDENIDLNSNDFCNEAFFHTQFFCRRCGKKPVNSPVDDFKNETETIIWANKISDLAIAQNWYFDPDTENVFCSVCAPHIHT
jgi:hypothetical protein